MAGKLTTYADNALLNHMLRNTTFTQPTALYVGLFTATPGKAGGGTEVSGSNYARTALTFAAAAAGTSATSADAIFPVPSATWGLVAYWAIFDALSGGNMLCYGDLTVPKTVNNGDTVKFSSSQLTVSLD